MKIPKKVVETIDVKFVRLHAKVCDSASYSLLDEKFNQVADRDDYVPHFFPYGKSGNESHFGDYIDLWIDIETGQIMNWKKNIEPADVARSFDLLEGEE